MQPIRVDDVVIVEGEFGWIEEVTLTTSSPASEYWDGDACNLYVTNTSKRTVELPCTPSAGRALDLWELRCFICEQLVSFLQNQHPDACPVVYTRMQERGFRKGGTV